MKSLELQGFSNNWYYSQIQPCNEQETWKLQHQSSIEESQESSQQKHPIIDSSLLQLI